MTWSDLYCLSFDWRRMFLRGSVGLRLWSTKSLPIVRRCSRKASSTNSLIVADLVTSYDSGAGGKAKLVADGEFACVSAMASSLAPVDWESSDFKVGVMSCSIEFWSQFLMS